jgi:hypothetical protein
VKAVLDSSGEQRGTGTGPKMEPEVFNEIVSLLAEILILDYQQHKRVTVGSPPLSNRKFRLTE